LKGHFPIFDTLPINWVQRQLDSEHWLPGAADLQLQAVRDGRVVADVMLLHVDKAGYYFDLEWQAIVQVQPCSDGERQPEERPMERLAGYRHAEAYVRTA
jgi:hypothetical protein